jgi:methyl-accepting chemotaxis protein
MASTRKSHGGNGRGNGVTPMAGFTRLTDEMAGGALLQVRGLGGAVEDMNEIVASLSETAAQAESARTSSDGLTSSVNELAASIEQVSANTNSLASSVAETAASAQESASSIQSVVSTAQEMATAAQQVAIS